LIPPSRRLQSPCEQREFFYLPAEIFADTLFQLIKDKGTGTTDMEKVAFSLK
jgi:hypothetical protein